MSDDLISLRMLVACDATADRDIWRRGAALASTPIDVIEKTTTAEAGAALKNGADIVVIDSSLAGADALIKQVRAQVPAPSLLTVADGAATDGARAKPRDAEEARVLVNRCLKMRLPTRVMVVDDSATTRAIVRKILGVSRFTLEIAEATSGSAALEQIKAGAVDIVLLDCNMPGQDGIETLAQIKRGHPHIAVVMMTSKLDKTLIEQASKAGAASFLKKPFFPNDIDQMLARYHDLGAIE